MANCAIVHQIIYTNGKRRFRTLFDRCDGCGERFTESTLKLVADKVGHEAQDDNIVFSCEKCFSIEADPVVTMDKIL